MISLGNSDFISSLYNISHNTQRIISISGKSGSGKTTLALQLIGTILTDEDPQKTAIWIQSSELFPKKRLISLYNEFPSKVEYLLKNIFVLA